MAKKWRSGIEPLKSGISDKFEVFSTPILWKEFIYLFQILQLQDERKTFHIGSWEWKLYQLLDEYRNEKKQFICFSIERTQLIFFNISFLKKKTSYLEFWEKNSEPEVILHQRERDLVFFASCSHRKSI